MDTEHPSWRAMAGTFAGYGLILVAMTLLLFAIPTGVFVLL